MIREDRDIQNKQLQELVGIYQQEPGESSWDWILNLFNQECQDVRLNKQEFVYLRKQGILLGLGI